MRCPYLNLYALIINGLILFLSISNLYNSTFYLFVINKYQYYLTFGAISHSCNATI